ncbi:MAG: class III lanthipeptide [Candidatus Bipolaricaulaceae bacterium]
MSFNQMFDITRGLPLYVYCTKGKKRRWFNMLKILGLQKLEVPRKDNGIAGSCTSSWHHCCNKEFS